MSVVTVLVMLVTLTAYSVSGTYAKYTSQIDLADEARVAKWEFKATDKDGAELTNKINLFKDSYSYNGLTYVKSYNGENVVAPGTTGAYTFKLAGNMEVRYALDFDIDVTNDFVVYYGFDAEGNLVKSLTATDEATNEYRPLRYSVVYSRGGNKVAEIPAGDVKALQTALNKYSVDHPEGFAPGAMNQEYAITWTWAEITKVDGLTDDQVNELDTFAGEQLSTDGDMVEFGVTVTATQVTGSYAE